ncbi:putative magnesium transport MgtC family protein [Pseudonocardia sulfidoxydans NBRC 16205]|uniref:Putative magnesium transport MgtC family protein n=1 Tax=Pseudonocardia sulfidoxydans NBRC 16205 TaxID=1223511 RepID=A0A511DPB8_9PSEU|nr:MgtC/SapB family protein [Pseudonocardia sulfidoxydans]GEL26661.1 putative magnesium transport MgtC family protein [Pseudonocardia sulfidoxydans NBRC 16205]
MSAFWSGGDQWEMVLPVALAMALTTAIGLEREAGAKSAGLRTHTLVGVGSAVFMLVSKYGFFDLLGNDHVSLDPSRIAAQVVSGIGFIGGGLIFVRKDSVRGLTTAATVWLAAAVGMACGAGLPVLAVVATLGHFLVTRGFPPLARVSHRWRGEPPTLRLSYADGRGVLRAVLTVCTERGFTVQGLAIDRETIAADGQRIAAVTLDLEGRGDVTALAGDVAELAGVRSTATGRDETLDE